MKAAAITLNDLFNLPSAVIYNPDGYAPVKIVTIDSRSAAKDSLFVAIKGEKFDGHDFVNEAVQKGASAILINKNKYRQFESLKIPVIAVDDTTLALGDLAKTWRTKLKTKIIAITGSAGKTTTKEIIAALLGEKFSVNKTLANNNNHIGVPLTIFGTNNKHDFLVLELGTNHFGEIKYTAGIAQPDYAVITNIGNSHLEFLKNKSGVFKEKIELFKTTAGREGFLFINNDDVLLKNSFKDYRQKISYGFADDSEIKGKILEYGFYGNPILEISFQDKLVRQMLPLIGEQNAKNFLAAAAIALKLGLSKKDIENAVNKIHSVEKRLNVKQLKDFILIDDTYNANPESMKSSIELLGRIKKYNKKIAVLGDMFELGDEAEKLHRDIAAVVKKNKIDFALTIGKMMKHLDLKLSGSGVKHKNFSDRNKLRQALDGIELSDSVVLVKGSRGMKMEEFVKSIEAKAID